MHPKRLLDGEGTEIERLLLASGRAARPSARAKWRTAILFFLVSLGTISKAHAVALLGAKARAWTVAQWLALGVGTGAAGWVAVHARAENPPQPPVAIVEPGARRIPGPPSFRDESPRLAPTAEAIDAPARVEPRAAQAPSSVTRAKRAAPAAVEASATERSIASEIDELDRAREALGMADAKRALERLNRYDRLFPQGKLREEALRLRIEAVASTGDRATARSLGQRFRALYPDSTHSERLKALMRDP
jgi:hypothetical protein